MENINSLAIEESIKNLPGIKGVKVVSDKEKISEIHILASDKKTPKQLIRDIESTVMVEHDLKLDHKIISIAQLSDEEIFTDDDSRLLINGFSKSVKNNHSEISVELANGDNIFEGKASGITTSENKLKLFSEATLNAIEKFLGDVCHLLPSDLRVVSIGNNEAILVSVIILDDKNENCFLGSALIKGEKELSVIKATLNAVNRRLIVLDS